MRIIILTAIPFWHPGTLELIKRLRKKNISVTALDIFHGLEHNENGIIKSLLPFGMKGLVARAYLKFFRNKFVRKHTKVADILDIHFIEPHYSKYIPQLNKKVICCLFGSDLFRTSTIQKEEQKSLFQACDRILLSKNMIPYFEEHFPKYPHKYIFNQYGSDRIDLIYEMKKSVNRKELKSLQGIPKDKIVVTCGYNAKQQQQHIRALKSLSQLDEATREKLYLLFPLTYGDEDGYIDRLKIAVNQSGFQYKFVTNRLTEEGLAEMRIVSDITLNTQTTDALASSIKEAMVAGDVLLVGDWLPYEIYKELGIYFQTVQFDTISDQLNNVIADLEGYREKCKKNEKIICNFASWDVLIDQWIMGYYQLNNES